MQHLGSPRNGKVWGPIEQEPPFSSEVVWLYYVDGFLDLDLGNRGFSIGPTQVKLFAAGSTATKHLSLLLGRGGAAEHFSDLKQ